MYEIKSTLNQKGDDQKGKVEFKLLRKTVQLPRTLRSVLVVP